MMSGTARGRFYGLCHPMEASEKEKSQFTPGYLQGSYTWDEYSPRAQGLYVMLKSQRRLHGSGHGVVKDLDRVGDCTD